MQPGVRAKVKVKVRVRVRVRLRLSRNKTCLACASLGFKPGLAYHRGAVLAEVAYRARCEVGRRADRAL